MTALDLTIDAPLTAARTPRHFLDLDALPTAELRRILDFAHALKARRAAGERPPLLGGRTLAMIFEKPSTRTRVSFEVGMNELGGSALILNPQDSQLGRGETIADTARVLSRYVDAIMIRCHAHETLTELAAHASVPVINGLTRRSHPCQLMADLMTLEEQWGPGNLAGRRIAWVGDGNNMCVTFVQAAVHFGFDLAIACPAAYQPDSDAVAAALAAGARVTVGEDVGAAVAGADCVVTDTWVSMDSKDAEARQRDFPAYQVNDAVMAKAAPGAVFMHCLPAHRGEEVTDAVMDGPASVVFDEAENRLHAQKAVLAWCLGVMETK
ncbi:MAG: ornithine carbamoyltransferase [Tistrella sp.]|jgi:ornithine carbamoyltransferase|uniref:Ornithine carbamoyltransferase n=1 Tax=Tistrella mobilis TaxID=171437 RepID=A0A3B9IL21_9PROT|nr:ornithine carbamoyltransferase [Tistrella sp.]MAD38046.1 ornithine carbamoyltransferase [Tistrella sp.]MBA78368.1 ornithine carbamoyltransferase [Tistrella sp.]HAE48023.1 ornithine carbamoyltransferase [Tistrella mobilis]